MQEQQAHPSLLPLLHKRGASPCGAAGSMEEKRLGEMDEE